MFCVAQASEKDDKKESEEKKGRRDFWIMNRFLMAIIVVDFSTLYFFFPQLFSYV
jgi:hypothetical protein